ncbi:MAG: EAL domain-containing protein [Gallionella sp.]|nr:EAL domain-containing protein [Gallionella sp.]
MQKHIIWATSLFLAAMAGLTVYASWRLHDSAIANGFEISEMHTRSFEDFLTQNLRIIELAAINSVPQETDKPNLKEIEATFVKVLRQTPIMRSMSLLDERGVIVASSNPGNIGLSIVTDSYLPAAGPDQPIMRIGSLWLGRDFSDGREISPQHPADASEQTFIPIARTLMTGNRPVVVLVALNPDYVMNFMLQKINPIEGGGEVLRYDGTLLLDSDVSSVMGLLGKGIWDDLKLSEVESGSYEKDLGGGKKDLVSFRASRLYPVVVVTHIHREYALQRWMAEVKTLLMVVIPALLTVILISFLYYRRQSLALRQKAEIERIQRMNATVFESSTEAIMITDLDGNLVSVNAAFFRITGYEAGEVLGKNPKILSSGKQDRAFYQKMWASIAQSGFWQGELINRRKDGAYYDAALSISVSRDGGGTLQHYVGVASDITSRKAAEKRLKLSASVFSHANEAILIADVDGTILDVNEAFCNITGYARDEVIGKNPRILGSGRHDREFYAIMWRNLIEKGFHYGEIWNKRKNGEIYPEMQTISAVRDEHGNIVHYVSLFSDITERKNAEDEIRNLAFYDVLTQLPNRRLLMERINSARLSNARSHHYGALLFLDLDKFKVLNDTLGHDQGDLLLIEVAQRLRSCVREMDTVARMGGDEFVVLLDDVDESPDVTSRKVALIAEKVRVSLSAPYQLKHASYMSSPSIGVVLFCGESETVESLIKQADMAMYKAKDSGRNTVRFFDPEMQLAVETRASLEADLRHAISKQQLHLYYQVQVDNERRPIGAEALVRWIHPVRGMVSPGQFIPIAEESSLIIELGDWVLKTACRQLATWAGADSSRTLTLAVNVSAQQFKQDDFVIKIERLLGVYRFSPASLKLELTEGVVLNSVSEVVGKMHALKALGIQISLDDFGTGYSSLSYLKILPLDQIKIDQSFVRDITTDPNDEVMVKTIIDMAQNFRLNVIAEGVETESQLAFLKQNGCMAYQGYLFGKPVAIEQFENLLNSSLS